MTMPYNHHSPGFHHANSSPSGDTTFTKVFVGGLAWETQSDTMRRYFDQFGEILEAVVITDKNTGRSKGYGFVTFRDRESARRACDDDPAPIIDGRRANCNLASLGRPRPPPPHGQFRSPSSYFGGFTPARGSYQQPMTYGFHQGLVYSPYGYTAYSPEYAYSQGVYGPYGSQQYLQMYGVPGAVNSAVYPYGSQGIPGSHGYTALPGYAVPGHQLVQFTGPPNANAMTATNIPAIPAAPYPAGIGGPISQQSQFMLSVHSPQFIPGSGSDQNTR